MIVLTEVRAQEKENPVISLIQAKVKDTSKPFALLVTFKVKEGKEQEFEKAFEPCLKATRKEPGCNAYYLNRDPDAPRTYVMYEQFKNLDAIREHVSAKHTAELFKAITPLTDGDLQVKVYQVPQ
jgi:quinol monooxygenase YgiN